MGGRGLPECLFPVVSGWLAWVYGGHPLVHVWYCTLVSSFFTYLFIVVVLWSISPLQSASVYSCEYVSISLSHRLLYIRSLSFSFHIFIIFLSLSLTYPCNEVLLSSGILAAVCLPPRRSLLLHYYWSGWTPSTHDRGEPIDVEKCSWIKIPPVSAVKFWAVSLISLLRRRSVALSWFVCGLTVRLREVNAALCTAFLPRVY